MARIRTIKPEFWTSEQVAECSPIARLMFVGLWNFCDDAGVHPAAPRRIKMQIFPADAFTDAEVEAFLAELVTADLLRRYTVDGKDFVVVTGWHHQRIDKPTFKYPTPPEFDDRSESSPGGLSYHSATDGSGTECSGTDGTGRECNGRDRNVRASTSDGVAQKKVIDWEQVRVDANKVIKTVPCASEQDRSLVLKACAIAQVDKGENWLWDSIAAVEAAYKKPKPPKARRAAYLHGVLDSRCTENGWNFPKLLAGVDVPAELLTPKQRSP